MRVVLAVAVILAGAALVAAVAFAVAPGSPGWVSVFTAVTAVAAALLAARLLDAPEAC